MNNSDSDSSNTGFHFIQEFEIPPEGLDLDLIPTSPELDDSIDGNSITEIGSIDTDVRTLICNFNIMFIN